MKEKFKLLRIFFTSTLVFINVVVILLFLISAFSDRISPEKHLIFSFMGLGFFFFFMIDLLFSIYWLFTGRWKYLLICLCSFLIAWTPIKSYFPIHKKAKEIPTENVIKVLTYNVMGFGYKDHTDKVPNQIVKYIAESKADIVCLQEYAVGHSSYFLTNDKLFKALKMYPYHSIYPICNSGTLMIGIAVYSKYPITKSHRIKYKSDFNGSSMHEINIHGNALTLVNNHLESFKLTSQDRSRYVSFIKNPDSKSLDGLKALQQKLGPAYKKRANEADIVAKEIKSIDSDYILVCGDFNDTPISYAHRTVQGNLIDSYSETGRGMGITYNKNHFYFRIDNILHSSNMKAYNCTIDKVRYSDHYPMWCYIELK